jgi:uncharacterized protein DUF5071
VDSPDLPRIAHKSDWVTAKAIVALGWPTVQPLIPHLLEWTQDGNWPVAHVLSPFLASIGKYILPEIRAVLNQTDDAEWKWFCIWDIIRLMDRATAMELRPELERLAYRPSTRDKGGEVDQITREVLCAFDQQG